MAPIDAKTVLLITAETYGQFLAELDWIKASFEGEHATAATAQQERAQAALTAVIGLLHKNGDKEQAELFWPLVYGLQTVLTGIEAELFRPVNKIKGLDFGQRILASQTSACVDWLMEKRDKKRDDACQFVAECLASAGYDFKIQHRSLGKPRRNAAQIKEWRKNIHERRHADPDNDERDNYHRAKQMLAPFELLDAKDEELKQRLAAMFKVSLARLGSAKPGS